MTASRLVFPDNRYEPRRLVVSFTQAEHALFFT